MQEEAISPVGSNQPRAYYTHRRAIKIYIFINCIYNRFSAKLQQCQCQKKAKRKIFHFLSILCHIIINFAGLIILISLCHYGMIHVHFLYKT